MPEGFFDAGIKANANGVIGDWSCQGDKSIKKLWIPNSITLIGNSAFDSCSNLEQVEFEAGGNKPLALGLMSFANCTALKTITLPSRTTSIGKGCFRDSKALEAVEIGEGEAPLLVSDHLFDNCAERIALEETIAGEVERRKSLRRSDATSRCSHRKAHVNTVLQGLRMRMPNGEVDVAVIAKGLDSTYEMMSHDADFSLAQYAKSYGEACDHFAMIGDWSNAPEIELRKVMVGSFVKKVAALNWGEIKEDEFHCADKTVLRTICSRISQLIGDESENGPVAELEDQFVRQFAVRRSAAFYRIIAAIKPMLVVQVPAIAKLAPLYAWLTGLDVEEAYNSGWYRLSRAVRVKLQELLPGKSIYQVGVFSWFLAEAFREDLADRADAKRRKEKVLGSLRASGLL